MLGTSIVVCKLGIRMDKRFFSSIATAGVLLLALGGAPAAAAATLVVDDDGMASAASCDATTTAYGTIQSAVDAAGPGDTVKVCPGSYPEEVVITKDDLKLQGAGAGISARNCAPRAAISRITSAAAPGGAGAIQVRASRVTIDGFTITANQGPGIQLTSTTSGNRIMNDFITKNTFGIALAAAGGQAAGNRTYITENCIANNNAPGSASGNGIYSDTTVKAVTISGNALRGHLNAGIILLGTTAGKVVNVTITNNTSRDDVSFANLSDVQQVTVSGNTVTQTVNGPGGMGSAIRIGDISGGKATDVVTVSNNTITSPHFAGVAVREVADNVTIDGNRITGTGNGVDNSSTADRATIVRNNTIRDVQDIGIYMEDGTFNNLITGNSVSGSGSQDCQDDTTGANTYGTDNDWTGCIPA